MIAPATDVAALYVDRNGLYPSRVLDWFDDRRDARSYQAELPVVAHPPCQRWCRLAGLVEARWGHKRGEDGGLFEHALSAVRRVGGVLEHPAYSDAWAAYGLPRPPTGEGWVPGTLRCEWTCYVEQWRYGHRAKKATWLYYRGFRKPFDLKWGVLCDQDFPSSSSWTGGPGNAPWRGKSRAARGLLRPAHQVSDLGPKGRPSAVVSALGAGTGPDGKQHGSRNLNRFTKKEARCTPPEFLDTLLALARWAVAA